MIDRSAVVQEIESAFAAVGYPVDFLDSFDQLECLASHNGSETFLVSEKATGNLFIAKCYDRSLFKNMEAESILGSLSHKGLPIFYRTYVNEKMFCHIRSYVEGTPLSEYAAEQELSQDEIVRICLQLADILIYLHEQTPPVIHRDIKPANIIIKEDGSVVLIDFDIARTFKYGDDTDTVFFGTKGYASPEQYGFTQTDRRSDIYSFGVLLRFLLTDSVRENKKIRLYPPLRKIIDRCTAFAPEDRYQNMQQVKKALQSANPHAQHARIAKMAAFAAAALLICIFACVKIYQRATYNPFTDGSVIPSVMPDEERQAEAVTYLQEKYGTHIFDDTAAYFTVGTLKKVLIEVYGMDEEYVHNSGKVEPPCESPDAFLPWNLDDAQYVDREVLAYFVTKTYWPDVVADWSSLKEDNGIYPGVLVAEPWCEEHGILIGVNRPKDVSMGEAAIAFANADKVYEILRSEEK